MIRHWLKHGRGPVEAVDDRLVPFPPHGLVGSLSEVERRPRLAGVSRVISRLEGALSLPPRRLDRSELQTDGYSDLTTRGIARADPADPVRAGERGIPPAVRRARAPVLPPRDAAPAGRRGDRPAARSGGADLGRRPARPGRRRDGPRPAGRAASDPHQADDHRQRRRAGRPGAAGSRGPGRAPGGQRPVAAPGPDAGPAALLFRGPAQVATWCS